MNALIKINLTKNLRFSIVLLLVIFSSSSKTTYAQITMNDYVEFDGYDDYLALDMKYQSSSINALTVEAWVRTSYSGGVNANFKENWAIIDFHRSQYYTFFIHADGRVGFSSSGGGVTGNDLYSNATVNDGNWHHLAIAYDGTKKYIYIDGTLDAESNPNHLGGIGRGNIRYGIIGDGSKATSYNGTRHAKYFLGDIGEVRVWNTYRDASTIDQYKSPSALSGTENGLNLYLTFELGMLADLSDNNIPTVEAFGNPDIVFDDPSDGIVINGNTATYQGAMHVFDGRMLVGSDDPANHDNIVNNSNDNVKGNYDLWVDGGIVTNHDYAIAVVNEWADFVFKDDYDLPSLDEIEAFIKKHGHLPNLPSEQEIIESGYTIHDMNKRLLKTIEELTLHKIEQGKLIDNLLQRIEKLENKQ